jgi:general stress protein 26
METAEKQKVYDILKSFSAAMFVTIGPSGRPESRPMQIAHVDDDAGDLWFFTGNGGTLTQEIETEDTVLLVFQSDSAYLSLRGKARAIHDKARSRSYWKEPYRVWFPGGPDDPQLALLGVSPIDAEYWDTRGSKGLKYMFEAAKAYMKGEKPEIEEPEQHGKTKL